MGGNGGRQPGGRGGSPVVTVGPEEFGAVTALFSLGCSADDIAAIQREADGNGLSIAQAAVCRLTGRGVAGGRERARAAAAVR